MIYKFYFYFFAVHFLVAEFLSSVSRHVEACEQRIIAAELSPDDYSLAVSVATALRLLDRKNEAEKWYRTVRNQTYKSISCFGNLHVPRQSMNIIHMLCKRK